MKLVIDITEQDFHRVCQGYIDYSNTLDGRCLAAISEGVPTQEPLLDIQNVRNALSAGVECVAEEAEKIEKIRAEIEQRKNDKFNCIGVDDVLKIIDKYAEQTDKSNLEKICEELTAENDDLRDQLAMRDRFKREPKWIPISEISPNDGEWAIFTDGTQISIERYKMDALDHFYPSGRWFNLEDAVAWMPLSSLPKPYPYKSQESEE